MAVRPCQLVGKMVTKILSPATFELWTSQSRTEESVEFCSMNHETDGKIVSIRMRQERMEIILTLLLHPLYAQEPHASI